MAATKTVIRTKKRSTTSKTLVSWFKQFRVAEKEEKDARARKDEVKRRLMEKIEAEGYEDDKGHRYLDLGEEVDGIETLCRQKRVSQRIDPERAHEFLEERGLWKKATRVERVLDESKLGKLVFEGAITKEELDALVDRSETFAFVPVRS